MRGSVCSQLRSSPSSQNLFAVHGSGGTTFELRRLARTMTSCNVYAFHALGLAPRFEPHRSVREMATISLAEMRAIQPIGPYALCGFSFGSVVAYEMALQLAQAGQDVASLIMLDTSVHPRWLSYSQRLASQCSRNAEFLRKISRLPLQAVIPYVWERLPIWRFLGRPRVGPVAALPPIVQKVRNANLAAFKAYNPPRSPVSLHHFRACAHPFRLHYSVPFWKSRVMGTVTVHDFPIDHLGMVESSSTKIIAQTIDEILGDHGPCPDQISAADTERRMAFGAKVRGRVDHQAAGRPKLSGPVRTQPKP